MPFSSAQSTDITDEGRAGRQGGGDGEDIEIQKMLMTGEDFCAGISRGPTRKLSY